MWFRVRDIIRLAAVLVVLTTGARAESGDRWERINADNGAVFAFNVGAKGSPEPGILSVLMCEVDVDDRRCVGGYGWAMEAQRFWFDCRGHYADMTRFPYSGWRVAPPYSVIGQASQLVCQQ